MRVAIITASTDVYKGNAENESGEAIMEMMEEAGFEIVFMRALPNDREVLSTVMTRMIDAFLTDLVLTTGGAGCGPSDCTPEATMDIIEKPILGIPEAMRAHTMKMTKRSMLNRCADREPSGEGPGCERDFEVSAAGVDSRRGGHSGRGVLRECAGKN